MLPQHLDQHFKMFNKYTHLNYLPFIVLAINCLCTVLTDAWLLAQLGLNESYRVRHLSTHFSRVFLSISVESGTFPTLIEAQWPETYLPMHSTIFPQRRMHANGNHSDCSRIQQARWSQVDGLNRLWVMDIGWQDETGAVVCPPKLLVFDLIRNNAEVLRIDCSKYMPNNSTLLVVKLGPQPFDCQVEKFVYFILADDPHILAYDILEQKWQRRKLISKKYKSVVDALPIKPTDMAFGKRNELLISDADASLYSSANSLLLSEGGNKLESSTDGDHDDSGTIKMKLLGSLLGASKGMMVDQLGALFYIVPKFGTVVRCAYKQNLTAEGNEIIYMTSKNVQQIFFGTKNSVWLLTDRLLRPQDHCFPG